MLFTANCYIGDLVWAWFIVSLSGEKFIKKIFLEIYIIYLGVGLEIICENRFIGRYRAYILYIFRNAIKTHNEKETSSNFHL
jgi:hypothetical protein